MVGPLDGNIVPGCITMTAFNFLQMSLWDGLFLICGGFKTFEIAFYHSIVNLHLSVTGIL